MRVAPIALTLTCVALLLGPTVLLAQDDGAEAKPEGEASAEAGKAQLPGVKIDREAGYMDVEAEVVLRDGEWLELLACTPGTREHESVLVVKAAPRNVHMGLLLLGLEPGKPLTWDKDKNGEFVIDPPRGPEVAVSLLYAVDGEAKTVAANQWVVNQKDGKVLRGDRWLFVGSRWEEFDGKRIYMADPNGSVLSLVNFGDEVLTRDTAVTRDNDEKAWDANTPLIPKVGTAVTIRLTPVDKPKKADP